MNVKGSLVPKENKRPCNRSKNGKFDTSESTDNTVDIVGDPNGKTVIHTDTKTKKTVSELQADKKKGKNLVAQ